MDSNAIRFHLTLHFSSLNAGIYRISARGEEELIPNCEDLYDTSSLSVGGPRPSADLRNFLPMSSTLIISLMVLTDRFSRPAPSSDPDGEPQPTSLMFLITSALQSVARTDMCHVFHWSPHDSGNRLPPPLPSGTGVSLCLSTSQDLMGQ